mmetsp:Transcript_23620/g.58949  ORF Transcript_23620/g.58949 Transcript_23620/m.58949 type:complete len:328 (+) Transcript_23620:111-1094(+)
MTQQRRGCRGRGQPVAFFQSLSGDWASSPAFIGTICAIGGLFLCAGLGYGFIRWRRFRKSLVTEPEAAPAAEEDDRRPLVKQVREYQLASRGLRAMRPAAAAPGALEPLHRASALPPLPIELEAAQRRFAPTGQRAQQSAVLRDGQTPQFRENASGRRDLGRAAPLPPRHRRKPAGQRAVGVITPVLPPPSPRSRSPASVPPRVASSRYQSEELVIRTNSCQPLPPIGSSNLYATSSIGARPRRQPGLTLTSGNGRSGSAGRVGRAERMGLEAADPQRSSNRANNGGRVPVPQCADSESLVRSRQTQRRPVRERGGDSEEEEGLLSV